MSLSGRLEALMLELKGEKRAVAPVVKPGNVAPRDGPAESRATWYCRATGTPMGRVRLGGCIRAT